MKYGTEMVQVLKNHGMNNYSIYFRKDGTLLYMETDNYEKAMVKLGKTYVQVPHR